MRRHVQQPRPSRPQHPLMAGYRQQVNGTQFHVNRRYPADCAASTRNSDRCRCRVRQISYRLDGAADIGYMADSDHSRIHLYSTSNRFAETTPSGTGRYN